MVMLNVLQNLSFYGGEKLVKDEGYVEESLIKKDDSDCDKLFLYPYSLCQNGKLIDRIYHAEYCNLGEDDEYEDFKSCWIR